MFVIENLIFKHQEKVKAWDKAGDKWVKEKGSYYDKSDYKRRHPHPDDKYKAFITTLIILTIGIITIGGLVLLADWLANRPTPPKTQETAEQKAPEKNCTNFNKGDYVRVQYGDYQQINGTIVGGCDDREDYQVKLDKGSKRRRYDSDKSEYYKEDVGDRIIAVDDSDNLVIVDKE